MTINSDRPQTTEHVNRLKVLPPMQTSETTDRQVTIHELLSRNPANNQINTRFICHARVTEFHEYRGWFYTQCSKCPKELYAEEDGDGPLNFVCKDDNDIVPKFMYCVNAVISDATGTTDVTFFNEGMTALLNISCEDLVNKEGNTDPEKLPHQMTSKIDVPKLLHLTIRNDGQIVVNNMTEPPTTSEGQSTVQHLPPTTPNPKMNMTKRPQPESPDASQEPKRSKE